jgi:hypothetical protein
MPFTDFSKRKVAMIATIAMVIAEDVAGAKRLI